MEKETKQTLGEILERKDGSDGSEGTTLEPLVSRPLPDTLLRERRSEVEVMCN